MEDFDEIIDYEWMDDSFIIDEKDCLKLASNYDELHSGKISYKYFVPMFSDKDLTNFRGNGVIIGKYLISAAHVSQSYHRSKKNRENYYQMWFKYDNSCIMITDDDLIFDGRLFDDEDGNNKDVVIYQLKEIKSDLILSEQKVMVTKNLKFRPIRFYDGMLDKNPGESPCTICSEVVKSGKNGNLIWKNCFKVNFPHRIDNGDSGSPIYLNNIVFGILIEKYIKEDGAYGKVLDSRYIKSIIDDYESKK